MPYELVATPVLLINQSPGTLFRDLALDISLALGACDAIIGGSWDDAPTGVRVRKGPEYDRRGLGSRLFSWVRFSLFCFWQLLWADRLSLVIVFTNPPFLPWIVSILGRLTGRPYLVIVYDIYPQVLGVTGKLGPTSPIFRLWVALNAMAFSRAEYVLTLTERMKESIVSGGMTRSPDSVLVVPTWVDTEWMHPIPRGENVLAREWELDNCLTVMYSGNIGHTHDVAILLDAADQLRDALDVIFIIIGDGAGYPGLLAKARALGLTNVRFHGFLEPHLFATSLPLADVSVVSVRAGVEGLMMPSKTYTSMAAGSAILGISSESGDLYEVIRAYGCGLSVRPGDLNGLVDALRRFRQDRPFLDRCKHASRVAAEQNYARPVVIGRILKLLRSIQA